MPLAKNLLQCRISSWNSTKVQSSRSSSEMILFHRRYEMVGLRGLEPPTSRLSGVRSNHLSYKPIWFSANGRRFRLPTPFGGDEENRTPDPLLARQVLSQLSYTPILQGLRKYFHSFHFLKVHNLSIAPSKLNNDTCMSELRLTIGYEVFCHFRSP